MFSLPASTGRPQPLLTRRAPPLSNQSDRTGSDSGRRQSIREKDPSAIDQPELWETSSGRRGVEHEVIEPSGRRRRPRPGAAGELRTVCETSGRVPGSKVTQVSLHPG